MPIGGRRDCGREKNLGTAIVRGQKKRNLPAREGRSKMGPGEKKELSRKEKGGSSGGGVGVGGKNAPFMSPDILNIKNRNAFKGGWSPL